MSYTRTLRAAGCAAAAGALLLSTATAAAADQVRDSQWALEAFGAQKVWKESTGKGITVAVIDNGVDGNHPDLKGNVLPGKSFAGGAPADRETKNNHGTLIASLIAGHGHGPGGGDGIKGLAPDAKIIPVKYGDSDSADFTAQSIAAPIRYAVDEGAKVINMSFIRPSLRSDEKSAIAYAAKRDVVLVAGSGNDGSSTPQYPAAAPGVVAVGGIGEDLKVWEKSNTGPHLLLSAPAENIKTAGVTAPYGQGSGTSEATAFVSAAAALVRSKFPDLTAGQVVNRLTKTALAPGGKTGISTPDSSYGYGVIRPYSALTANVPPGPENGPLKIPSEGQDSQSPETSNAEEAGKDSQAKVRTNPLIFAAIGVGVLVVVATAVIIVAVKRKNSRGGPPPGGPSASGHSSNSHLTDLYRDSNPPTPPAQPPGR